MVSYSFNTRLKSAQTIAGSNGYGYATKCMLRSWDNLGFDWGTNESTADIGIVFDQPPYAEFYPGQYKILFHPWESTLLLPGWAEIMNECDEIWTPSPLIADWYTRYAGVKVPVYVYEHGIESEWKTLSRPTPEIVKFLHVGAEASRKGGWDTVRAFRAAFPYRDDVELTMKMIDSGWNGINRLGRVNYVDKKCSFGELQDFFYDSHVYVYPSAGEGFGFTPLQAMTTGMPTITVPAWAPYEQFLDDRLNVSSKMVTSSWPKIHPGKVFRPDFDDLVEKMRFAADNFEELHADAIARTDDIRKYYDWDRLTEEAFSALEQRLQSR